MRICTRFRHHPKKFGRIFSFSKFFGRTMDEIRAQIGRNSPGISEGESQLREFARFARKVGKFTF
jgi:hypothetical protein